MEVSFLTWQFFSLFPLETFKAANPQKRACRIGPLLKGTLDLFQAFFATPWEESKQNGPPKKLEKDRKVSFFLANLWKIIYLVLGFKLMEISRGNVKD